LVSLTAKGRGTLRSLRTLSRRVENEFLAPLSEEERTSLHDLLLRLAEEHETRCAFGLPPNPKSTSE
jgi:DNA-binding MarR family transcriptional regulator